MKRVALRSLAIIAIVGLAFTAFMGFAHTKAGRPALVWIGSLMGKKEFCPLGYDQKVSATDRAKGRLARAKSHEGKRPAVSREILDFELGRTTREQVNAWAYTHRGNCHALKTTFDIECAGPFFSSREATLWMEFDEADRLVSAKGIETFATASEASGFFTQIEKEIRRSNGSTLETTGIATPAFLTAGLLRQAVAKAEMKDFSADLRVTNLGHGFAVSQNFAAF